MHLQCGIMFNGLYKDLTEYLCSLLVQVEARGSPVAIECTSTLNVEPDTQSTGRTWYDLGPSLGTIQVLLKPFKVEPP
ncbi:hypothetical protein B0H10DRAFT_2127158 [Mycena sp. CBHHK59/15]|nr:hypothetical protein B0H10DRAFT_2127158 [Mycena sp. CBHHK59/15]